MERKKAIQDTACIAFIVFLSLLERQLAPSTSHFFVLYATCSPPLALHFFVMGQKHSHSVFDSLQLHRQHGIIRIIHSNQSAWLDGTKDSMREYESSYDSQHE